MEEAWSMLCVEFEKWRTKYINLENYMRGNVFHYTNAVALENIFRNMTLWVTKSDFLNDKTEYLYAISLVNKVFKKNKYKYLNENIIAQINRAFKSYLSRSFIFSTSLNSDSVNLWGNYSEHEGYNIGFDLREVFSKMWDGKIYVTGNNKLKDGSIKKYFIQRKDSHNSIEMSPGKVIYDIITQENIIVDIFNFLDHISEKFYSLSNKTKDMNEQSMNNLAYHYNNAFGSAIRILINQIKLFKNPVFSQDEEYRIIFDVNSKLNVKKYRQYKGVFIPYIEVVFDKSNAAKELPVNSITIGPKNNLDIATKGLSQFLSSQGYKISVRLKQKGENKLLIRNSAVPLRY